MKNTNGHEYVDLGLPSGTLWATKPLMSEDGQPLYFAWGGIQGMTKEHIEKLDGLFGIKQGKVGSVVPYMEDYWTPTKYNETDGKVVLDLEDDAAHVHMGGDWHMPTKEQFEELKANTTSTWTTQNGVNGRLFTSKVNGNSIFVPAFGNVDGGGVSNVGSDGYVWSSSVEEEGLSYAWLLYFSSSYLVVGSSTRAYGYMVFGVVGENLFN